MHSLYDVIGATYTRSRRADPAISRALAQELQLTPSGAYLDLACGTGNYTVALSSLGGAWSAIDVSEVMLAQARR
jgi:ubiquinone/menaquinone biosynthesis C-methylase UbiE